MKPILFNDEMVRAILEGRKTQTRRPVKENVSSDVCCFLESGDGFFQLGYKKDCDDAIHTKSWTIQSPFGKPGDKLWVRETCYRWTGCGSAPSRFKTNDGVAICYADDHEFSKIMQQRCPCVSSCVVTVPSIHMPRWASRITLTVKRVWVERVQDISNSNACYEGVDLPNLPIEEPDGFRHQAHGWEWIHSFKILWNSIYEQKGLGWDANPWVWGCEFEVAEVKK